MRTELLMTQLTHEDSLTFSLRELQRIEHARVQQEIDEASRKRMQREQVMREQVRQQAEAEAEEKRQQMQREHERHLAEVKSRIAAEHDVEARRIELERMKLEVDQLQIAKPARGYTGWLVAAFTCVTIAMGAFFYSEMGALKNRLDRSVAAQRTAQANLATTAERLATLESRPQVAVAATDASDVAVTPAKPHTEPATKPSTKPHGRKPVPKPDPRPEPIRITCDPSKPLCQ